LQVGSIGTTVIINRYDIVGRLAASFFIMYDSRDKPNNGWTKDSYKKGIEGEIGFYELIREYIEDFPEPDLTQKRRGDGGVDFLYNKIAIQVKTNCKEDPKRIEHLKLSLRDIKRAHVFILMSICGTDIKFEGWMRKDNVFEVLMDGIYKTPYVPNKHLDKSMSALVTFLNLTSY